MERKSLSKNKKQDSMKKVYQKPLMEILEAETAQMLAASSLGIGNPIPNASVADGNEFEDDFEDESLWW